MISRILSYFSGSSLGSVIVKAVIASAGVRILGMGLAFLVGIQLARGLGAEGYGIYGLAMSIVALLTIPTEFGLPQLLTREVATGRVRGNWAAVRGVMHWAFRVSLLIAVAVAAIILLWLVLSGQGARSVLGATLIAGVIMVPFIALGNLNSAALRGLEHVVKSQLSDTLVRPAAFALLLFAAMSLSDSLSPMLAMSLGVFSAALALILARLMLRRELPDELMHAVPCVPLRGWWSSALPMAMTEGMRVLQAHVVIIVLGMMSTAAMVGVFRVATSMVVLVGVPITLLNIVSAPLLARLFEEGDRARLQRLLGWISVGTFSGTILLTLPFVFAGRQLLSAIFGVDFAESNVPLLILSAGLVSYGVFGASATLLNMSGLQARVTRASATSLVFLLLALPLMISAYGIEGAAAASSLAVLIWNVLMWLDARRLLNLETTFFGLNLVNKK